MVHTIEVDKPTFDSLTWSAWLRSFDINGIVKVALQVFVERFRSYSFQSVIVLVGIGAVSLISIRTHLRRGRWFSTIFIVGFVFSVAQNWYALYQVRCHRAMLEKDVESISCPRTHKRNSIKC